MTFIMNMIYGELNAKKNKLAYRLYETIDISSCIYIFDSNVPHFLMLRKEMNFEIS